MGTSSAVSQTFIICGTFLQLRVWQLMAALALMMSQLMHNECYVIKVSLSYSCETCSKIYDQ